MPDYSVRIELNGPPGSDVYDAVHEAMAKIGYERQILSSKGGLWKLPKGMYDGTSTLEYLEARNVIAAAVKAIWPACEIIVFEYERAAWIGLTRLTNDNQ